MSYSNVENEIEMWGLARGIIQHGKPMGQAFKTMEECTELLDAINKGDKDAVIDAIGDIGVTLLIRPTATAVGRISSTTPSGDLERQITKPCPLAWARS